MAVPLFCVLLSAGTSSYALTIDGFRNTLVTLAADEDLLITASGNYQLPGGNGKLIQSSGGNLGNITNNGNAEGLENCTGAYLFSFGPGASMGQITNTGTMTINTFVQQSWGANNFRMFYLRSTSSGFPLTVDGFDNSGTLEWINTRAGGYTQGFWLENVTFTNGFVNSGTLRGLGDGNIGGNGIAVNRAYFGATGFVNSGDISIASGPTPGGVIYFINQSNETIHHSGTLTNYSVSAVAVGMDLDAVSNLTLNISGDITTQGTTANIFFRSNSTTNTVNIFGNPTLNNAIQSQAALTNTVNITGEYTTDIANQFISIGTFGISSGGHLTIAHNQTVNTITNSGTIGVAEGVTRTLTGNYVQNSGAVLQVNLDSGNNPSILSVTGDVTIDPGSTVHINAPSGTDLETVTLNNLITAGGTFTGTSVSNVTTNLPNFALTADLSGSTISITAASAVGAFLNTITPSVNSALPSGVSALVGVLQSSIANNQLDGDFKAVLSVIGNESTDQAAELEKLLPPKIATGSAIPAASLQTAVSTRNSIAQRAFFKESSGLVSPKQPIRQNLGSIQRVRLGSWGSIDAQYARPEEVGTLQNLINARNFWLQSTTTRISHRKRLGVDGYRSQIYNFAFGFDTTHKEKWQLGLGAGYSNVASESRKFSTALSGTEMYKLFLYTNYAFESGLTPFLNLDGYYAVTNAERRINIGNSIDRLATSKIHANAVGGEIGIRIIRENEGCAEPRLSFEFRRYYQGAYHESGAASLNLQIERNIARQYAFNIGAKLPLAETDINKWVVTTNVRQAIKERIPSSTANFSGGGGQFVSTGLKEAVLSADAGLQIQYRPEKGHKLLQLSTQLHLKEKSFGASGDVKIVF